MAQKDKLQISLNADFRYTFIELNCKPTGGAGGGAEKAVGESPTGGHTREGTEQQRTAGGADKEAEKAEGNRTGAGASLQESRRFIGNCAQPLRISENHQK